MQVVHLMYRRGVYMRWDVRVVWVVVVGVGVGLDVCGQLSARAQEPEGLIQGISPEKQSQIIFSALERREGLTPQEFAAIAENDFVEKKGMWAKVTAFFDRIFSPVRDFFSKVFHKVASIFG